MILVLAKWIIWIFGYFIIFVGLLMLLAPENARRTLRKAGSTNFINYAEITIRIFPALALVFYADFSKFPESSKIFGWIMLITSFILYFVPRKMHHKFSMKSADMLKPIYLQLISPFAIIIGGLIIYNAL